MTNRARKPGSSEVAALTDTGKPNANPTSGPQSPRRRREIPTPAAQIPPNANLECEGRSRRTDGEAFPLERPKPVSPNDPMVLAARRARIGAGLELRAQASRESIDDALGYTAPLSNIEDRLEAAERQIESIASALFKDMRRE
jgi:hypothetical protein